MTIEELKELREDAYQFKMIMEDREFPATYEDRILELIDEKISQLQKEPCEYCELEPTEKIYAYGMSSKKIPVNYCPNCSRKLR